MDWVYLSPHFDDAILSCGGLIWEQTSSGDLASVWTICGGEPLDDDLSPFANSLHSRWQSGQQAVKLRRQEDMAACARLSASYHHLSIPDSIYRRPRKENVDIQDAQADALYPSLEAIFGPVHFQDEGLVRELASELALALPAQAQVVCPLSLGGHVDHRLTRLAAEKSGRDLWYYADYPYVLGAIALTEGFELAGWKRAQFLISPSGLTAWQEACAAYQSQISTFWPDQAAMEDAIRYFLELFRGALLWRPPGSNLTNTTTHPAH